MTPHSYQNGLQTLGRQILLLPVVWTADGWFKVADGLSAGDPIRKAQLRLEPVSQKDSAFSGQVLDLQWQFWKGYDRNARPTLWRRTYPCPHADSLQTTSPLTRAATDRTYTVEVDVEIMPGCEAGLLLFYDNNHCCGLRVNGDAHVSPHSRTNVCRRKSCDPAHRQ